MLVFRFLYLSVLVVSADNHHSNGFTGPCDGVMLVKAHNLALLQPY